MTQAHTKDFRVLKQAINKAEIQALIPHSGLMCLLDRVTHWDDQSITCLTETHHEPTNPLRRNRQLSAVHGFEYGAQAAAVHGGLRARIAGTKASPGYLAALRDAHLHVTRLDDCDAPLQVYARRLFGSDVNCVYECHVSALDRLLVEGRLTIIQRG